jgi:hypothetical protein
MKDALRMSALEHFCMSNVLIGQLEFVARQTSGKVTISLDCSVSPYQCEVRFNGTACPRGNKHEAVTTYGADALNDALAELLKRLGVMRDLPTPENIIGRATPRQLARLSALLAKVRDLKQEILQYGSEAEPCLRSPRSSLNPAILDDAGCDREEDDADRSEASRQSWRTRRHHASPHEVSRG